MDLSLLTINAILLFLLMLLRITGMVVAAPFFSQMGVPVQVQVGIAFTLSLILFPLYSAHAALPADNLWVFSGIAAQELVIGLLIGFAVSLIFAAIQLAGQHVTTQMGLGVAHVLDPVSHEQSPVMGQVYFILAILLFLSLNFHHQLILAVAKSFETVPLATHLSHFPLLTARFVSMGSDLFMLSIMLILPVLGIMLILEVATAFVSKLMPQVNIFMVALPLKIGMGLLLIYITLPFTLEALTKAYSDLAKHILVLYQF